MRIALISDIHANEVALKAVLKEIERSSVDKIVCLGDITTLGPCPDSVTQILQDLKCDCILGNHDEFMIDPELVHTYTQIPPIVEAIDWARKQLSDPQMAFIRSFASQLEISSENQTLFIFHGSPRNNMEDILSVTSSDKLDEMLEGHSAPVMACGHTHIQMLRQYKGTLIVNPGSVGFPIKEFVGGRSPQLMPHAEYAIIDIHRSGIETSLRRLEYDRKAFRKSIQDCPGPIKLLFPDFY